MQSCPAVSVVLFRCLLTEAAYNVQAFLSRLLLMLGSFVIMCLLLF